MTDTEQQWLKDGMRFLNPTDHENDRVGLRIGFIHKEGDLGPGLVYVVNVSPETGEILRPQQAELVDARADAVVLPEPDDLAQQADPGFFNNSVEWSRSVPVPGQPAVTTLYWSYHVNPAAVQPNDQIGIRRADHLGPVPIGPEWLKWELDFAPEPGPPVPGGAQRRYLVSVSYSDTGQLRDRVLLYYRFVGWQEVARKSALGQSYVAPVWWCRDPPGFGMIDDTIPAIHEITNVLDPASARSFIFRMVPDTYAMVYARSLNGSDVEIVWKDVGLPNGHLPLGNPIGEKPLITKLGFVGSGDVIIGIGACRAPEYDRLGTGRAYVVYATFQGTIPTGQHAGSSGSWFESVLVHNDLGIMSIPYSMTDRDANPTSYAQNLAVFALVGPTNVQTTVIGDPTIPTTPHIIVDDEFLTDADGLPYIVAALTDAPSTVWEFWQFPAFVVPAFMPAPAAPAAVSQANAVGQPPGGLDPRDAEPMLVPGQVPAVTRKTHYYYRVRRMHLGDPLYRFHHSVR